MISVFEIIAFEAVAGVSLIYDENTCNLQSTCYPTVLRFQIGLAEIISNSICSSLMENWHKIA